MKKKRKGQEEIVGFALIIIIVAVIALVFLGISLNKQQKEAIQSYETESFVQALLQYTTNCSDDLEYLSVRKLVFSCDNRERCEDGRDSCEALNLTFKGIIEESWKVGQERPVKGFELKVISEDKEILVAQEGNATQRYREAMQAFNRKGRDYELTFRVYS